VAHILLTIYLSRFSWVVAIKVIRLMIIYAEGNKMLEHAEEIQEREMMTMGRAFMGFLMGVGAILGIWFLSGFLQVMSIMMG
jgi:hypothetical protein